MAPRKKKSDLATVTTKPTSKKATQAVFDAQFTKVEPKVVPKVETAGATPDLNALLASATPPAEPDELINVKTGTVAIRQADGTFGEPVTFSPVRSDGGTLATQTAKVLATLTPKEREVMKARFGAEPRFDDALTAAPVPPKYKAFTHVQANVKGGIDANLAPCTAIVGPNRSHKTAVLDAIKLAILGKHPGVADRPESLLAFASTGATNLTATISGPNGSLTTMLADEPGFKRPKHEATGELNELLAAINVEAMVPTVAIGELLSFGETRMREAVFGRFGKGIVVKMPDGLSGEQQELWLSTEKLLRSEPDEKQDGTEPTYAKLAEKFRQLKLEAGRQVKRSEESASKAREELGEAVLIPKDQAEKLHVELERLTKWSAGLEQAAKLNKEYQADKERFVQAFNALGALPFEPGTEPAFGTATGLVDTAALRMAKDEAGALAEQDTQLLLGLSRVVTAAEKSNACPCCRNSAPGVVDTIRATHAAVSKRHAERQKAANDATIALTNATRQNEQRAKTTTESIEHKTWRNLRDARAARVAAEQRLAKQKEALLARKAALPPEPPLQAMADTEQALNDIREQLKKITVQAGQTAVLEAHETEARVARNHNGAFKVLEVEAKGALQRTLAQVSKDALACVNRYVPAGWEVKLTLDDGACRWEIVGADGEAHGKGVASGSEWTTLTLALACAWTEGSPLRVLLVDDDDLGKLSPKSLTAFLDRLREVVEGGWLTQVVVAWTRPEEIPTGWVKVERTA